MQNSQALRDARRYEELYEKKISGEERPVYHLTPRTGWMNDPNGFSYYQGKYHLFYQYNPYASQWDTMHWGHAVTEDFLHWEYLPCALAPDASFDFSGCFSGDAITLEDGRQLLIYTGVQSVRTAQGHRDIQTQNLAIGDGIDYEKLDDNPAMGTDMLPEGSFPADFRDPKIWRGKDGKYYCIASSRAADKGGQILLFKSEDAFHWEFVKILIKNGGRFGAMWECPDLFELDGKWVFLTCPMDMQPKGLEYHNGNGNLCIIGSYDEEKGEFTEEADQAIDYGIDFYATQTVLSSDGRRIMIGWLQNWDAVALREPDAPWAGQMSTPRELSIKNGRLFQLPVREILAMRKNEVSYQDVEVKDCMRLDGICGRVLDIELSIRPKDPDHMYEKFALWFAEKGELHTALRFRPHDGTLKIDRKFSGSCRAILHQRRCYAGRDDEHKGELKLRILLDRFSAEIFIGDGEKVMSAALYTPLDAEGISFHADGEVMMNVTKYDLV